MYPLVSYSRYVVRMHQCYEVNDRLHGHTRRCALWGLEQTLGEMTGESHNAGGNERDVREKCGKNESGRKREE